MRLGDTAVRKADDSPLELDADEPSSSRSSNVSLSFTSSSGASPTQAPTMEPLSRSMLYFRGVSPTGLNSVGLEFSSSQTRRAPSVWQVKHAVSEVAACEKLLLCLENFRLCTANGFAGSPPALALACGGAGPLARVRLLAPESPVPSAEPLKSPLESPMSSTFISGLGGIKRPPPANTVAVAAPAAATAALAAAVPAAAAAAATAKKSRLLLSASRMSRHGNPGNPCSSPQP